ncbi:hypothetical protein DIE14_01545 [Burkholderia sp. Bp9017]|uniref:hypothetical protein n=1 Tax=unclassified Burkholderia TaxID=2613784 RepID=UPI000F5E9CBE|nr:MULTISPECIES: hypothetical protein [unclassified Burkholderia]RQZ31626.1 hypothetical protein DIE14_01545 [Burkholderia sp. Bp9017]RQZ37757.1 hypothetical protein DIE13_01535 [Burkholderia sp. Bp9016]
MQNSWIILSTTLLATVGCAGVPATPPSAHFADGAGILTFRVGEPSPTVAYEGSGPSPNGMSASQVLAAAQDGTLAPQRAPSRVIRDSDRAAAMSLMHGSIGRITTPAEQPSESGTPIARVEQLPVFEGARRGE